MEKYQSAYKWLLIPFIISLLGFTPTYYLKFTDATFGQHIHGLSATLWYLFVVYQPYLITKKRIRDHKKHGIYGIFLAGLVVASAMIMIPNNLIGAQNQLQSGDINPIAPPFFLYGISLFDFVSIIGFAVSVLMAIRTSSRVDSHAAWMISSVFWVLMPALTRLALIPMFMSGSITHFANLAMLTTPLILISILIVMYRLKNWHPAFIAAFLGNLMTYLVIPVGHSETWISVATALFTTNN